ncbi:helix-turn-helix domain-containing protein [Winogradskyella helgolandensis]|uniref:helix-turn-helix domain-containing protein n=1 Tax=Winogradskyella helgolandensis TaxID=2697010 RepID=UPI001E4965E0|nr:helix-turn-helix domain-containing protein [Winogradskyella helgolandensis]
METIQRIVFTQEQLNQIKEEFSEVLKPLKNFMSVDDLSVYLELSKSAIYKMTSKKEIPFYNPGGKKIYFKRVEVDAWIESGRIASDSEILYSMHQSGSNSNDTPLW